MLVLTLAVAGLGDYFAAETRPRRGGLPLWLGSGSLVLAAVAAPLLFASDYWFGWLLAGVLVVLIQAGTCWQLPRLLAMVLARRSGLYNLLVGLVLAALFASFLLGWPSLPSFGYGPYSAAWRSAGAFPGWPSLVDPW